MNALILSIVLGAVPPEPKFQTPPEPRFATAQPVKAVAKCVGGACRVPVKATVNTTRFVFRRWR